VREIAKDNADVTVLAKGSEDPHQIVPKPSFIGKLRQADLFIMNGASLEIGFVPPLLQQANNPRVAPGGKGFFDLSKYVDLIGKPAKADRSEGDIHPEGNPHFVLDWQNVPKIAAAVADALSSADPGKKADYEKNLADFAVRWKERSAAWDQKAAKLKGKALIQYHRLFNYFFMRTGMTIEAELEPKPGIPPTGRHIEEVIANAGQKKVIAVVTDAYHDRKPAEGVAKKLNVPWAVLPHDVNAVDGAGDLFKMFDKLFGSIPND
jgi:zinc/manganese transport system substrate-binding protein